MSREVRRVPPDWEHPKEDGHYKPLFDGYAKHLEERAQWDRGFVADFRGGWMTKAAAGVCSETFEDYAGEREASDYMPEWPPEICTHYQMYETTSEGTPISPPMPTPEALARWLAESGASAFADHTASYEEWLAMIRIGSAPSAIIDATAGTLKSGVAGLKQPSERES